MRFEELCRKLLELGETSGSLRELKQRWVRMGPELEILHHLNPDTTCSRLLGELERAAARFLRSLSAASGPMASEWESLAVADAERFKDSALALHEYLRLNEDSIKPAFARAEALTRASLDPFTIFDELRQAGALSEHTWLLLRRCNRKELESKEARQRVEKLARMLFELQGGGGGVEAK